MTAIKIIIFVLQINICCELNFVQTEFHLGRSWLYRGQTGLKFVSTLKRT